MNTYPFPNELDCDPYSVWTELVPDLPFKKVAVTLQWDEVTGRFKEVAETFRKLFLKSDAVNPWIKRFWPAPKQQLQQAQTQPLTADLNLARQHHASAVLTSQLLQTRHAHKLLTQHKKVFKNFDQGDQGMITDDQTDTASS